jgi:hypothetical protein
LLLPVDLKVEGRLPVRIVLKASGIRLSPVKFVVRKEPEFGKVRLIKQLAGDSVEVEYVPPANLSIREDFFWFAASNAQGFSSDTRAHIRIMDIGPRLKVALALDFPATRVGQSSRQTLEVLNSGDQPTQGNISTGAPWEVEEGGEDYALAPGERKIIGVLFKPSKPGWSQTEVQLNGDAPAAVQLRGEALDWVEVAKDPFSFVWAGAGEQKAELVLSNSGERPLDLTLGASPPLEHEAKIRIEAGTTRAVPMRWSGGAVPGGWGTLLISSQAGMRRVVVWNLDAILSGLGTSFLLEGEGESRQARRTFTNLGGRSGTWTFRCTPPFFLSDAGQMPKVAATPSPAAESVAVAPAKKQEEHAAIPGFVWDHNLNRYVPFRSVKKTVQETPMEPKEAPPSSPRTSEAPPVTELTRRLQSGESFVLFVGVSGNPAGASGTLFVNGPGLRHAEPLLLRDGARHERLKARGVSTLQVAEKKPAPAPRTSSAMGADLPPVAGSSSVPGGAVGRGTSLPRLFAVKKEVSKPEPPPTDLMNAFLPAVVYKGFRVKDISSDAATIVFPVGPGVKPGDLEVRYCEMLLGEDEKLVVKWVPFREENRRGKRVGDEIEIRLRGLTQGGINYIDLLGPLVNGGRDKVCEKEIVTLPVHGVFSPWRRWPWVVLAVALVGAFASRHRWRFGRGG